MEVKEMLVFILIEDNIKVILTVLIQAMDFIR